MITHNTYNRMTGYHNNMLVARDDSAMNILYDTKFWSEKILAKFGKLQAFRQNFLAQNVLLGLVRNMHELAWMALLKYFQLKCSCKQPLRDLNGEMSTSSEISSANMCMCVGKLLH